MRNLIKELFTNDGFSFTKNDKGQEIYYPWHYPGESFILNTKLKKFLLRCCILLTLSFLACGLIACFANDWDMINANTLGIILGVIVNTHGLLYLLLVIRIRKKCQLYVLAQTNKPIKIPIFPWIFVFLQLHSIKAAISQGSLSDPLTLILLSLLVGSAVLTISILFLIIKTRGYVFEKTGLFRS